MNLKALLNDLYLELNQENKKEEERKREKKSSYTSTKSEL